MIVTCKIVHDAVAFVTIEDWSQSSIGVNSTQGKVDAYFIIAIRERNKVIMKLHRVGINHTDRQIHIEVCLRSHLLRTCTISIRLYPDNRILVDAEADAAAARTCTRIVIRIKHCKREIVVTIATPAPVDMEEAVAIVTITDEGVSAIITITTILHRFAFSQLIVYQILPTIDGIGNTLFRTDRILISEILDERLNHLLMIAT